MALSIIKLFPKDGAIIYPLKCKRCFSKIRDWARELFPLKNGDEGEGGEREFFSLKRGGWLLPPKKGEDYYSQTRGELLLQNREELLPSKKEGEGKLFPKKRELFPPKEGEGGVDFPPPSHREGGWNSSVISPRCGAEAVPINQSPNFITNPEHQAAFGTRKSDSSSNPSAP